MDALAEGVREWPVPVEAEVTRGVIGDDGVGKEVRRARRSRA